MGLDPYKNSLIVILKTLNKHGRASNRVGKDRPSLPTKNAPNLEDDRQDPNRDCQDAQKSGHWTTEELEKLAVGLDGRGYKVVLDKFTQQEPKNHGCDRDFILLHQVSDYSKG